MTTINDVQVISMANHIHNENDNKGVAIFQLLIKLGFNGKDKAKAKSISSILRHSGWTKDHQKVFVDDFRTFAWFPPKTDDKDQEILNLKAEIARLRKELELANQKLEWKSSVDETISFVKECQEESETYPDCSKMLQDEPKQLKAFQQPLNSNGLTGIDLRELAKMMKEN